MLSGGAALVLMVGAMMLGPVILTIVSERQGRKKAHGEVNGHPLVLFL
jgi:hypothetical protein